MKILSKWPKVFRTAPIKSKAKKIIDKTSAFIKVRPFTSFVTLLVILFALIAGGHYFNKPKIDQVLPNQEPKSVEVYQIGKAPKITVSAQVEKSGVVQIVAQVPGIVAQINVKEGQKVSRGQSLVSLSSNYQGGNSASLARQLAQKQFQNAKNTFDTQKEIIAKQREFAQKNETNSEELRTIIRDSLSSTRSIISLNNDILNSLGANLTDLESTNIGGINDDLILATKQQQSQYLSANSQLQSTLSQAEFASSEDKTPANITDLQKQITLKQLDVQEKGLDLSKATATIQLKLAQVAEAQMFPASPFSATVERVYVKFGDTVSPGTPIATLSGANSSLTAVVKVPQNIAKTVSKLEPSVIKVEGNSYEITPFYISSEATYGTLYSVLYSIPPELEDKLTNMGFVEIEIPVGYAETTVVNPFVPLDTVHVTQDKSYVFVMVEGTASAKEVTLGNIEGAYVQVLSGIGENDIVIVARNIIAGELVRALNP